MYVLDMFAENQLGVIHRLISGFFCCIALVYEYSFITVFTIVL